MLQPFVNVHFPGDPIYYMTAIFLASQCEFSRFTDKPVEENGYQDVKCYNTDNLLPLHQVALSLCICLLQGLEAGGAIFAGWHSRARESELGGAEAGAEEGGSFVLDMYTIAYKLRGKQASCCDPWRGGLALCRCFFPQGPGGRDGSHPKPGSQQGPTSKSQEERA